MHDAPPPATPRADKALHSRMVQRLHRRYADVLPLLPPGLPDTASLQATLAALQEQGHELGAALRILRQLVLERLAVLDCDGQAPLQAVTACMTDLAELSLDVACEHAFEQLDALYGPPLKADGSRVNFWIVGMGKLGARELNVSSDIDLVYLYEADGQTAGKTIKPGGSPGSQASAVSSGVAGGSGISFQDYFAKVAKRLHQLIGETTEHGFVFRIDLALRPNGNSGPVVASLDSLAHYLQVQGREWERFAWMKSRIVAPRTAIANQSGRQLRQVVLPFVFRRYLDFNVYESLRVLHDQIRNHAIARSAGRPERANDVKLSRGGIREIEFIVQLLQVVRGGQFPEVRRRPTLAALQHLARAGFMSEAVAEALAQAYIFLRRVEHRIQYLDDQQTHVLPTDDDDLLWIAQTMGYEHTCCFMQELLCHRDIVAREFDTLLSRETGSCPTCCCKPSRAGQPTSNNSHAQASPADQASFAVLAAQAAEQGHAALQQRLLAWQDLPRVAALRPYARTLVWRLLQNSLQWLQAASSHANDESTERDAKPARPLLTEADKEVAVLRFIDWLETILRRQSYLALMLEQPAVHTHLLHMLALARWPARYLMRNPGVIDELAHSAVLQQRFEPEAFKLKLALRLQSLQATGEDDEENVLNLLRRAMHAETFRTLARDLGGQLSVEQVADDLSALADATLEVATRWCWQRLLPKARAAGLGDVSPDDLPDHFAIIAYGKLGGLELGYGSDLDLVFLYEDSHERAGEIYATLVRKLIMWLTTKTGEGDLYEIDTALRPNGNSGLLTTTVSAFENYQLQRGSNTAWVWEHQAMTRARCCFGSPRLHQLFDRIREQVLTAPRDAASLQHEIVAMRQRVSQAHAEKAGVFDLKHSPGGMIDAEFVTQYLVLLHSAQHLSMLENRGNIALLERADDLGILPTGQQLGHAAAKAYRDLRRLQHRARLNEETAQCPSDNVQTQAQAICALWQAVFGQSRCAC
ncbi:MAG: bifunctional [glutamate--ammonia ligase]-adenylyl-L-tyrosine phosphorylase/[glutamate--ammonia-ligase] adenylyltransferase [Brachymonas sp.]|nr:bifunctional [glutamate--ammonia ligase]-adenylyl-L-tyrosine phosphorylase/[glutamate--ammonia-ligase] adenylyltransferase [Brachymonas sp.]